MGEARSLEAMAIDENGKKKLSRSGDTYEATDYGGNATVLKCRNLLRHGADDGQAAKDANGGPKHHGNVAQRTCHGGVGAVPEKVRYGMRKPGKNGCRQDRVEDAVDVDVPSKRTSYLRFHCCRCDMRTHVGIGEGRCKVGVGPSRGKVGSRRMEAR